MIVRNPSSWIRSLSSNFTWTNRELEWYFAEDRFLFAAKDEDECDRWVCIMNWLLAANDDDNNNNYVNTRQHAATTGDEVNHHLQTNDKEEEDTH